MEFPTFSSSYILIFLVLLFHQSSAATSYPKEALPTKSGYLTVNSKTGSSIFYTYYESQNTKNISHQTPILIWLQGGPGCSSMLANYREVGPYLLNQNATLYPNPYAWNKMFGLLFLDNPIGTGFSIATSKDEIPRNQYDVSKHLIRALEKFYDLDSSYRFRPLYLTGESYAGKYLPALGYYIMERNKILPRGKRVNLGGVSIGNGLTDPVVQVQDHAVNAFNLGLINRKQMGFLDGLQKESVGYIKSGKWHEATVARNRVLNNLTRMTGLATLYDFRRLSPYPNGVVDTFLNNVEVKRALRAKESIVFSRCSDVVGDALHEDVMKSVRGMVEYLVRNTRVLLYQGQCDLRDGVTSTLAWVEKMNWGSIDEFLNAEREVWRVGGNLAGYVQKYDNLSNAVVLNAGHLVPTDQPLNSQIMIQDWILERGLFGAH